MAGFISIVKDPLINLCKLFLEVHVFTILHAHTDPHKNKSRISETTLKVN